MTEQLLKQGKRFTGLIAFDDLTAFASIGALSSAGFRVPADCSVIGFDDIPGAAFYNPPLTTVCQHLERQGLIGADLMRNLLSGETALTLKDMCRRIEPQLVVRKSTSSVARI